MSSPNPFSGCGNRLPGGSVLLGASLILTITFAARGAEDDRDHKDENQKPLQTQIDQLIAELNDAKLTTREAAEQQIVELATAGEHDAGSRVLALLPEINDRLPPEVRHRLARARKAIESALAKRAVAATVVTLEGQELQISAAFNALTAKTGNRFLFEQNADQPAADIDVEFVKTRFWPAVDTLLDAAGLDAAELSGSDALKIVPRSKTRVPRASHAAYAGPMRIEVTNTYARRDTRDPSQGNLRVELEVAWEPRLEPIRIAQSLPSVEASDDTGNLLVVANQSEPQYPIRHGYQAVKMQIPFQLPDRSVTEILSLKGKLRVLVPGKEETFRFDELPAARQVTQSRGGVAVTLRQCRQNGGIWEVHMTLGFDDAADSLQSHMGWVLENRASLASADGKRVLEHVGFETVRQSKTEISLIYLYELPEEANDLAAYVWEYVTPAELVDVPIAFELNDVPLP